MSQSCIVTQHHNTMHLGSHLSVLPMETIGVSATSGQKTIIHKETMNGPQTMNHAAFARPALPQGSLCTPVQSL